jgi:hypothetical protein
MKRNFYAVFFSLIITGLLIGGCVHQERPAPAPMQEQSSGAIPKEDFHIYIAFGQSNMQGPGAIREQDKTGIDYSRWQTLNVVAGTYAGERRAKGQWYNAVPPLIVPDGNLTNYLGLKIGLSPADYFGRTLVNGTPENVRIGVIAVASGDMALAAFHNSRGADYRNGKGALNGRPSQTERDGMNRYIGAGYANMYDAVIKNAKIAQQSGVIKGIIVHQGESGPGFSDTAWIDLLKEIYDAMLFDLGFAPNSIPILLGQLWNGGTGPGGYLNTNNTLIQAVIPNAWVISSAGCNEGRTGTNQPDNLHFGPADLETFGRRYGEKMLELVY